MSQNQFVFLSGVSAQSEKALKKLEASYKLQEIDIKLRASRKKTPNNIKSDRDAYLLIRKIIGRKMNVQECFIVLYFNPSNNLIGYYYHSIGGIRNTQVDVQLIIAVALKVLAARILVAHNHPSGGLLPSKQDYGITDKIGKAAAYYNIKLLDHLIVTGKSYYSIFKGDGVPLDGIQEDYIQAVCHILDSGEKQNKRSIDKLAAHYGLSDATHIKELTELAIVLKAREISKLKLPVCERFDQICELYRNQVNLSHRTSQSLMLQQYSTPAPLSFLASMYVLQNDAGLGNVKRGGRFTKKHFKNTSEQKTQVKPLFFEPSAGNGLLTIALPPELTIVNEIDELRYQNLCRQPYYSVTQQDATEPFVRYSRYFEGVVSNPPFGALHDTVMYGDFPIKHLDHLMALRALDTMKDKGRAAIIIGGHTAWDSEGRIQQGKNRIFLSCLYRYYYVEDILNINGDLYSRQGTSFDVRLILINGRKPTPEGYAPLKNNLDTVISGFETLYQRVNLKDNVNMRMKNDIHLIKEQAKSKLKQLKEMYLSDLSNLHYHPDLFETNALGELDGAYRPVSDPPVKSLETVVPDSMDYEVHSALINVKEEVGGSINAYVRGYLGYANDMDMAAALSAEQVDAVAMAIYNIEEKAQGMIIGDQTGIGKGRIAAAVIRYACKKGLKPIFITEKANLFSDMYRDLSAIGSASLRPFIVNANESKTKVKDEDGNIIYEPLERSMQEVIFDNRQLPSDCDYVMMTYSQIASNKPTNKQSFVNAIAQNNILILDESHNAGGDLMVSATARFFFNLVKETKGVIFLSATFAKRPDNMPVYASKTCMSDASLSNESLVDAIIKGGVALQEVLSANLVAEGQMLRRERSFEGIEVNYITLDGEGSARYSVNDKEQEHRAIVDNITEVLRGIIRFQSDFIMPQIKSFDKALKMEMTNAQTRKGTEELGVSATPYFSKVFNVVNQMLFSVKADEVAQRAIQRLKEGKAPVIAFSSTMGAFLEEMENERGTVVEDGDMINADFAEVLKRGLSGILRYSEVDETGKSKPKMMSLSELLDEARIEYMRLNTVIEKIATGISISPIDRIKFTLQQAGYRIAEVTGRKLEVRFEKLNSNVGMVARRKKELVNDAFRKFNNNQVDVLLINQSGSTGASAHAIVTPKVPLSQIRQRVMIVLQAELDINREVQKRGRINRTGQVFKPIYDYVNSAIPAEKRMAMMLQKKLKSLDANTTSNQRNSESLLQSDDFLNKYGDKLVVDFLMENPELNQEIGDPLGLNDNEKELNKENAASKVSGRVAVLPTVEQQRFYEDMLERYRNYVSYLLQTGDYDLEVETMDLQAKTIERYLKLAGKGGCKSFGGNTYIEKCEVNTLKKPFRKQELENIIQEALNDKSADEHKRVLIAALKENTEVKLKQEIEKVAERSQKAENNIHKEKKYKDLNSEDQRKYYYEERLKEIQDAAITANTNAEKKIKNQANFIYKFLNFFKIGEACYYPDSTGITSTANYNTNKVAAVFLGFKVSMNKPNPFAPSAVFARFAVASASKYFEFALSGDQAIVLERIIAASYNMSAYDKNKIMENWDTLIQEASANRSIRYIYTGNLLQAYGNIDEKCKLISYSTHDGANRKGILMPESWKFESSSDNRKVVVPLIKAIPIFKNLKYDMYLNTDNGLSFMRTSYGYALFTSSLSVQRFEHILKNPDLLAYITNANGFQKAGTKFRGDFGFSDLDEVVKLVYESTNCTVSLDAESVELIQNEIQQEKIETLVFPKLVELEVKLFSMIKGRAGNLEGLSNVGVASSLSLLKQYYPFNITSERAKILSDMVREVETRTNGFTNINTISDNKVEVRYLLEKEHIQPSEWMEYKHTFKRSEADVVDWLADEVRAMFTQSGSEPDKIKRIRLAKVKAQAKIKLLNLLAI